MNPQFMYRAGGLGTRETSVMASMLPVTAMVNLMTFQHGLRMVSLFSQPMWFQHSAMAQRRQEPINSTRLMHEIRARARSTKEKDLPPPAHKSPLDYLKKGK